MTLRAYPNNCLVMSGRVGLAPPLFLSTHLPNERHSEPRPIHTVLLKCAVSPNQQGTSCILLNPAEPRVTLGLIGRSRITAQVLVEPIVSFL